ncbi:MAG TPA: DNA ligase D [Caulobacteraceae bacterium]|nr:DNA ligase D [Caulobacteraceae bacterium]
MAQSKLARYQSMRDFQKTAEPSGDNEKVVQSDRLRFVIQKHAATRLHFDLRLEFEGVFKSWAVTRGPSFDPHDRRLAVEVEDHPLDYGDFEGTIPKGQYGGGAVMLWDRGFWAPEPGVDIAKALKKGELKFVMEGGRMHGGWVLVRLRDDERAKRHNWLLIKHRDEYARDGHGDAEALEDESIASGRSMEEIAAGKGKGPTKFMTGGAKGARNAVWQSHRNPNSTAAAAPKLAPAPAAKSAVHPKKAAVLPPFVAPQLAKLVDRPPQGEGWAHEVKFDGYRMQLRISGGKATLKTRKGLDWTDKFTAVAKEATGMADAIIDGELCALDDTGAPDFAALQAAIAERKTDNLILFVFDILFASGQDLRHLPLADRKELLKAYLKAHDNDGKRIRFVEHLSAAGDAVLASACRMDLEGIVSKKLDAPYRSGRTETWVKSKCRAGHEVVIGGWTTTGEAFRSLIVGVYREGKLVHVGRVGTGFGRDKLTTLLPKLKALATDTSSFVGPNAPKKSSDTHFVKPELVAEIEYAGFTGDGNVRQAAFKALREDKPAAEVEAEKPAPVGKSELAKPQAKAKMVTPSVIKTKGSAVVMDVTISHADKALWPDAGDGRPVTKLDLAQYYEAVGEWMMRYIEGRPCSIIRIPDGLSGERFFQRHASKGSSALFNEVQVFGDHKPYLQIDRIEALAAAAQISAAELHPWNCQPYSPEEAGRLVFDFDPAPDVAFEEVIRAAHEAKDRLEAIGLVAFCKITGGKGLHVVTPLAKQKTKLDWPTAKGFARAFCEAMEADSPGRYLVNMSKAKRTGKIFLDYLRNDRMATAVAPLSPRARDGAPVSMPLTWSQVKRGLDPMKYTIRTVPALLRKSKAWEDYCEGERPLDEAIKKLK